MSKLPPITPDPVIEAYKREIDRSLLRENLKLTPEERIRKLMELQRFAEELRRAGETVIENGKQQLLFFDEIESEVQSDLATE